MQYYNDALLLHRGLDDQAEYANILNNMAYVKRLNANLEDALISCKLALRIRREMFMEGSLNEYYVGLSLSTLGHIYHSLDDLEPEAKAFNEAFEIYNRAGDKSGIASTYNRLGRIKMKRGALEEAKKDFEQAARIAVGLNRAAEIESLNQLGRLNVLKGKWQDGADCFQTAVDFARQVGQEFELAENLLYLADVSGRLENPSNAQISELIKEAKRLSRKNNYVVLLALAGQVQGDIYMRKQEYLSAFRNFRVHCRYMAERGYPEYNRALRRLSDLLLETPGNTLPAVIDSLLSYWSELGLNEKYPELPEICKKVGIHMLL
jgi:tetratricopeptide (TPR) repeat protein